MGKTDTARINEKLRFQRNRILSFIRKSGGAGRLFIARQLRISNSRVCDIVQEMLDSGLIIEENSGKERRGRRSVPLRVNPDYGQLVGFDMESKMMRVISVDFSGKIIWQRESSLSGDLKRDELIDRILAFIEWNLKKLRRKRKKILGIGLAAAGIIDVKQGVILHYDLIKGARDIPLKDIISKQFELSVCVEENIRALTLAEWIEGAGVDYNNFICFAVRSGLGCGMVIQGKLYAGANGLAGDVGSIVLPFESGRAKKVQLYDRASENALDLRESDPDFSKLDKKRIRSTGNLLGSTIGMLVTIFDPGAVILAGNLLARENPLWPYISKTYNASVLPELADLTPLIHAELGPWAAAIGATHRLFETLFPTGYVQKS